MRTSTRLAILAFAFNLTSCGPPVDEIARTMVAATAEVESTVTPTSTTGVQDPACTPEEPDEFGNVVHWCDDGSHWWIDSDTGTRYDTDASGNTTTTETID